MQMLSPLFSYSIRVMIVWLVYFHEAKADQSISCDQEMGFFSLVYVINIMRMFNNHHLNISKAHLART